MNHLKKNGPIWLGLAAGILISTIAYWPSLKGGFVFDDHINIVLNTNVHVQSLDWRSLYIATLGQPSAANRPLAMISFAIDWYFGGGDPLRMKVANLVIHLVNGLLLFGLLRTLFRVRQTMFNASHADVLALCIAVAWMLAPINFTAVAYIVQRMESLSQLFVLAGLWGYIAARIRMRDGNPGFLRASVSIVLGTAIGGLSKESAALLPLYALLTECIVFRFVRSDGRTDRRLFAMYFVLLALPACVALYWVVRHALPAEAWASRPFTLGERLLTEPRILVDYLLWSLLPLPNQLALYHDNIELSRGLFSPPNTILAILALASAILAAFCLRHTRPLLALGAAWFFAAHLLTATVIPLELAFEHRNYFASIGLYLALFSTLLPSTNEQLAVLRKCVCVALIVFFASVTWIRALNWGSPMMFALSEAQANPRSPRAAYELANTYMALALSGPEFATLLPDAYKAMKHAATMPGANILGDQGLLLLSAHQHRDPPKGTWARMQHKLAAQPLTVQNVEALNKLEDCTSEGRCSFPPDEMVRSFIAALQHQPPDTRILAIYSSYAFNVLHDTELALSLAHEAVTLQPHDLQTRRNYLLLLVASGQRETAQAFYELTLRELPDAKRDAQLRALLEKPPMAPASQ